MAEGIVWHVGAALVLFFATWRFVKLQSQKRELDEAVLPTLLFESGEFGDDRQTTPSASQLRRRYRFLEGIALDKLDLRISFDGSQFARAEGRASPFCILLRLVHSAKSKASFLKQLGVAQGDRLLEQGAGVRLRWNAEGHMWEVMNG